MLSYLFRKVIDLVLDDFIKLSRCLVKATDADGDQITYDITGGNNAGLFLIHAVKGTIQLTKNMSSLLLQPHYTLNISATDQVYLVHSVVRVKIRDINDHAPVFTKCAHYNPSIPENSPPGTTVLRVSASDGDLGTNGEVEYAIVQQQYGTKFGIDRTTGRIETKTTFDREQDRKFSILVKATDGGSVMKPEERLEGSCSIEVTITDINDNQPVFESTSYTQNIGEYVQIGHRIIKVSLLWRCSHHCSFRRSLLGYSHKTTKHLKQLFVEL